MSVKNTTPLSERLLCLLKSETSFHDCLVLQCRDLTERRAHRTVLIASSPHFSKLLQDDPAIETVDVPFTSDVIDIVIEFLYSSGMINFKKKQAIQLYSAASYFSLEALTQQMQTFFRFSMDEALADTEFLVDDTAEDVKQMMTVFAETQCNKLLLVSRILRWEKSKNATPEFIIELIDSVIGSQSAQTPPQQEGAGDAQGSQIECEGAASSNVTFAPFRFTFALRPTDTVSPSSDPPGFSFQASGKPPTIDTTFGRQKTEKSPFVSSLSRN